MNETVAQVIPVIRENRRKFEEFCFSLSEEELVRPVPGSAWIVRDFASHLATLDTLFDGYVTTVERGGKISMTQDAEGAPFDLDAWNDAQVAERQSWPIRGAGRALDALQRSEARQRRLSAEGVPGRLGAARSDARRRYAEGAAGGRARRRADVVAGEPVRERLPGFDERD
jgi:hypothetical protein